LVPIAILSTNLISMKFDLLHINSA
jgi:hypothetical protein